MGKLGIWELARGPARSFPARVARNPQNGGPIHPCLGSSSVTEVTTVLICVPNLGLAGVEAGLPLGLFKGQNDLICPPFFTSRHIFGALSGFFASRGVYFVLFGRNKKKLFIPKDSWGVQKRKWQTSLFAQPASCPQPMASVLTGNRQTTYLERGAA